MASYLDRSQAGYKYNQQNFMIAGRERREVVRIIAFLLLHIPLAFLLRASSLISTVHALFVLGIGLYWLVREKEPTKVLYVIAYITGAEILWRGTGASVFWEYGKYASTLLLILMAFKYRDVMNATKWPFFYFALLVPSIFILPRFDREWISFNLSGPLTLAAASMIFSSISLKPDHVKRFSVAIIAPILTLAFLASYLIATAERLAFSSGGALVQTSAGIGPNQVSSTLGLGALVAFLYVIIEKRHTFIRTLMLLLTLWLLAQTLLTFSRGGFWGAVGSMVVAGFYLLRERRSRAILISASIALFSMVYFVLFPSLNRFTGNTLKARFSDFSTTGRLEIMEADWIIFKRNPVLGVGPHQSKQYHALTFRYSSAHTEYTRMLSEHGSFGLLALVVLLGVAVLRALSKKHPSSKALIASLTVWSLLFMFHSAMRLVAPSIMFGMASAHFSLGEYPGTKE